MRIDTFSQNIRQIFSPIITALNYISLLSMFSMMMLTVADVFMRKVFNNSILGTVEVTELMMIIVIFFALSRTELLDGNVKVDLVLSHFTPRIQALFDMITQLCCLLLFVLVTLSSLQYAEMMRASSEVSQDLLIPIWPFVYVIVLGTAMLTMALLIRFLEAAHKVINYD